MRIGIVGGTGMLGKPVVEAFAEAGHRALLLVRDVGKASQFFGDSVDYMKGDLLAPKTLKHFVDGVTHLYLNLSVEQHSREHEPQPEREGLRNLLEALKGSDVERIGYLSSLVMNYQGMNGFDWWAFRIKHHAVNMIKECPFPSSVYYPSTFMESFDKGAYRQGQRLLLAGKSKHKMYLIAGKDYGRQVLTSLEKDKGNCEHIIQGLEGFTADEAAAFYKQHYYQGRLQIMRMPIGALKFFGRMSAKMNYGAHIVEALNNYPESFAAQTSWQALGKPTIRFEDYIRKSA